MTEPISWEQALELMDELRGAARQLLAREAHATLSPSQLVWTALRRHWRPGVELEDLTWDNRRHLFGAMYRAMRCALIDRARARRVALGRGFGQLPEVVAADLRIQRHELGQAADQNPEQLEALIEALERMATRPDQAKWVELLQHHYFSNFTWAEAGRAMDPPMSESTVMRIWQRARLVLYDEVLRILNRSG